eukprot:COSAG05_NODE_591_length_8495_cov_3436.543116_1_plen_79_part_00
MSKILPLIWHKRRKKSVFVYATRAPLPIMKLGAAVALPLDEPLGRNTAGVLRARSSEYCRSETVSARPTSSATRRQIY